MDGHKWSEKSKEGKKGDGGMIGSYHSFSLPSGFLMMKAIIHTKRSQLPLSLSSVSFLSFFCPCSP